MLENKKKRKKQPFQPNLLWFVSVTSPNEHAAASMCRQGRTPAISPDLWRRQMATHASFDALPPTVIYFVHLNLGEIRQEGCKLGKGGRIGNDDLR